MPLGFLLKAVQGCDYDSDELYKSAKHAAFIKNMCLDLADNGSVPDGTAGTEGDNFGVFTPIESTEEMCPIPLPAGDNFVIGYHESEATNEGYVFVYNSGGQHLVYVIDGYTSRCRVVKQSPCWDFKLRPENFISSPGRVVLETACYYNRATALEEKRKYLIFTDGSDTGVRFISVEDSISTKGFTLPFFSGDNCSPCNLLRLGVPTPSSCIQIDPIERLPGDNRDNLLQHKAFQFRIKGIDVWNRETEHGIISDIWYSASSQCARSGSNLPRCLALTFDAMCSTITKIQIEFRIWEANDPNLSIPTDWYLHDTIDKYDESQLSLQWYQRVRNPQLPYDALTNRLTYTFCYDRGTTALPVPETMRNYNPLPLTASSVFAVNKSIGTANHRRGFTPLNVKLLEQIKFDVQPPDSSHACKILPRTITVYGHLEKMIVGRQALGGEMHAPWDRFRYKSIAGVDRLIYGSGKEDLMEEYQQVLPEGNTGVIGYLAGTSEWVFSEQCNINIVTGVVTPIGYANDIWGGRGTPPDPQNYRIVQRWRFVGVTPGKKIVRLANATATAANYKKTSFPILGISRFPQWDIMLKDDVKEIEINECEGDVDIKDQHFILVDLTCTHETGLFGVTSIDDKANLCVGYLYEDEVNRIPIENARVTLRNDVGDHNPLNPTPLPDWGAPNLFTVATYYGPTTDHNGYYWSTSRKKGWRVLLASTLDCQAKQVAVSDETVDEVGSRVRSQDLFAYGGSAIYHAPDRILIKGRVVFCGSDIGVSGIGVVLTGGGYAISDENGDYTIPTHPDVARDPLRPQDQIKFTNAGLCAFGTCADECSACFTDEPFNPLSSPCTGLVRTFTVPVLQVNIREVGLRGPQNGGRYELGIVPYRYVDQPAFVQRVPAHVVDMPTIGQTGIFDFSRIHYSIPASGYPADINYLTLVISKNLNWDNFLTWIAEKVVFVDNTGNANAAAPTQIKLYYSGMLEYNLQNGMATNSVWQFLDEKESPVIGDKVEFIVNGDGTLYAKRLVSLVKFDREGGYILVNYSEDLKGLKDGAQIKIVRPRANINSHFFYEQCKVIRLSGGSLVNPVEATGYLNYFDAYMVARQIPIPFYSLDPVTHLPVKDLTRSVLKTFIFPFEHHSPSDFWADHAANRGRIHTVNPFEAPQCYSTEIALSKALAYDGALNGLSYFTEDDTEEFDEQEWGAITVVVAAVRTLTVICQENNFTLPFDDDTVRVSDDGKTLRAGSPGRFGRPVPKQGSSFGCHVQEVATVKEYNGLILFVDRSDAALVLMTGGEATDVSVNGFKGWLKDKIKEMVTYNRSGQNYLKYFHATFDPKLRQYLLTSFKMPAGATPGTLTTADYVNQLRYKLLEANETIGYSPYEKSLKLSYSFTPEYFGTLYGHAWDMQLLSFKGGVAYMHHKKSNPVNKSYLVFYGVLCEAVYEPVLNEEPNAVKRYLWTEVLSREQQFFCDQIVTESGQRSRLLLDLWEKRENFFTADFKCDTGTYPDPNVAVLSDPLKLIQEGNPLSGKWIKVRYVARPPAGQYFEFDGVHIFIFVAQKSGIRRSPDRRGDRFPTQESQADRYI